uniref:Trafficking protein particle complex subunit 2-like protein n=1 Tax=Panagrellus redivivus TaxID=6233 RepID=A0A7E4VL42_PANRE
MLLCISILAADQPPLYFRCIPCDASRENDLRLFVYSSLDVFDEKATSSRPDQELFLGSLFLNNKFKSYGYLTNTQIKFLAVIDATNPTLKEQDLRALFKKVHQGYSAAICNPFYELGTPIQSRALNALVDNRVD